MKKIYSFIFIVCSLFNYTHSFAQANTDYYVINVGATTSEAEASKNAQKLTKEGYASSYLWIPDFASLSGAKYFMFYIGPFKTQNECEVAVQNYRKKNPSAIGLLVSNEPKRVQIAGIGKVTVFDNVKANVRFKITPLPEDISGTPYAQISVIINNKSYLIKKIAGNAELIKTNRYREKGIPSQANDACGAWWAGSGTYFYIVKSLNQYVLYEGWQEEGQEGFDFHWKKINTF